LPRGFRCRSDGPDLIFLYNDAFRPILGDKHPGAFGRPLHEVWSEVYPALGTLTGAILRGEREAFFAVDHPWTIRRGAGTEDAHFTISYSPIPDPAAPNRIGGVLTTCIETTERVRNEAALQVLNDRLEAEIAERIRERDRIWQVSEDLLGVSNFEGYFTSVNPAWARLLGWSEDEIKQMHLSELRHPDDAPAATAGRRRLAEGVPTVRMENRFRHKDGSWRWLSWMLTAENGVIYVIGRHVTTEKLAAEALRESERQFRLFAGPSLITR
jgi:PAS domain S-box-containing protein